MPLDETESMLMASAFNRIELLEEMVDNHQTQLDLLHEALGHIVEALSRLTALARKG